MTTVILDQREVRALLPMERCIELVDGALRSLARGEGQNPLRRGLLLTADGAPDARASGLIGMMPGRLGTPAALGLKVVTVFPRNHGTEFDSHQGVVCLFDPQNGVPIGIFDASEITALRTAAASAVATRALAREDAGDLALLGSGVQARTHLEALALVRRLRRVRVFSPSQESREGFARRASERHGIAVEAVGSARAAVEGADLVCAATSARTPVLRGEDLAPGAHVNAVGACVKDARELDAAAVARARVFVDRRESADHEAGDLLLARAEGAIGADHVQGELGDVLLGRLAGRTSPDEITLFESLGIAVEDLAAALELHRRALATGTGTRVELGGRRDG
jgi:ornithine cyclodeaminase